MSNLPDWPGASVCYSRAYRLLEAWARNGGVTVARSWKGNRCYPSDRMVDLIDALNRGDEEVIKGTLLENRT